MPTEAERKAQSQKDKSLHKKSLKVEKKQHVSSKKPKSTSAPIARASFRRFAPENVKRVIDREFVGNVGSQDLLAFAEYRCNPADTKTFPRLSVMAATFEQYTFHKLRFVYEARVPTTVGGTVILSPDYDCNEAEQNITEAALMNTREAVDGVLWEDLICDLKHKSMFAIGPRKYTSRQVRPDRVSTDAAILRIATQQSGATPIAVAGKLWVEYDVEFFVPSTDNALGSPKDRFVATSPDLVLVNGVSSLILWDPPVGLMSYLTYNPLTGVFTAATRCKVMVRWRVNVNLANLVAVTLVQATTAIDAVAFEQRAANSVVLQMPVAFTREQFNLSNACYLKLVEGNTFGISVNGSYIGVSGDINTIANFLEIELIN